MSIKTVRIAAGIKRIINLNTGADVLIAQDANGWLMMTNTNGSKETVGLFATVKKAETFVSTL